MGSKYELRAVKPARLRCVGFGALPHWDSNPSDSSTSVFAGVGGWKLGHVLMRGRSDPALLMPDC